MISLSLYIMGAILLSLASSKVIQLNKEALNGAMSKELMNQDSASIFVVYLGLFALNWGMILGWLNITKGFMECVLSLIALSIPAK